MTPEDDPITDEVIAVAIMLSDHAQQRTIALNLGISESEIGGLKQIAIDNGLLKEFVTRLGKLDRSAILRARNLVQRRTRSLLEGLQALARSRGEEPSLRAIHVFDSGAERIPYVKRREKFGAAAAETVYKLIRLGKCEHVMVAYGATIQAVIRGIDRMTRAVQPASSITFLPLRGDPVGASDTRTSPSTLALEFSEAVNRMKGGSKKKAEAIRLSGVPAIIPVSFNSGEAAGVRRLAETSAGYCRAFGRQGDDASQKSAICRGGVDCILTSFGSVDEGLGEYSKEYIRAWGVDEAWVKSNLLGDLAGLLIPNPALGNNVSAILDKEVSWLPNSNRETFKLTAGRRGKPGVIAMALGGEGKARVAFEVCVSLNAVNHLVIDHELERHLRRVVLRKRP